MTVKKQLKEAGALGVVSGKKSWYARLIAVGAGSSGFYTTEALRDTGPAAWPVGTKINSDHQSFEEYLNQPAGSIKTLIGVIASTPEFKDDGTDLAGLYANVEFSDEWAPFVEQFAPHLGLSITAQGWGDNTNEEGQTIIEGFVPSVLNTVDLVTAAGAKGKLIAAIESYKESDRLIDKIVVDNHREEIGMTPEDIQKVAEALAANLAPLFTKITEALTPVVVEPVVEEETIDIAVVTESLIESGLSALSRKRVIEAVTSGTDLTEAVTAEKAFVEEILAETATDVGRIQESLGSKDDFTVGGWK